MFSQILILMLSPFVSILLDLIQTFVNMNLNTSSKRLIMSSFLDQSDYYRVLDVERDATTDTIKKAYRKLALRYHPDRNPKDLEASNKKFKEISEAYSILSDPDKKSVYDRFGKHGLEEEGFSFADISPLHIFEKLFDEKLQ